MAETIICPKCKSKIPLSKALTAQIEDDLRRRFEAEAQERQQAASKIFEKRLAAATAKLEKQSQKKADMAAAALASLQGQIVEAKKREKAAEKAAEKKFEQRLTIEAAKLEREAKKQAEQEAASQLTELQSQLAEAHRREKTAQASYAQRLAAESSRIAAQARKKAQEAIQAELSELREQISEKDDALENARQQELELTKRQRQLERKEKTMALEIDRKVKTARRQIEEELTEENRLREIEQEKKASDLRSEIADLKRKAEQGSQQTQGEAVERAIEKVLKQHFPQDEIISVSKGKAGADVTQRVYSQAGQLCGTIVWESKNTRAWSKGWISKLKTDQRREKAELAVLVSTTLPKDASHLVQIDGVWVTGFSLVFGLATALRANLIDVARIRLATEGKAEMKMLFNYLTGPEFRHRVEAIVDVFREMQSDLEKERETTEKRWAKREKQNQLVIQNLGGMYGDMQGIAGQTLPKIKRLSLLPAPEIES